MSFQVPATRKDAVVAELRTEILAGALPPGAAIRDAELAQRLGISITPVREAVTQLIAEGLITALPNKRRSVTVISDEEAADLMEYFGVLICSALARVAPQNSKDSDQLAEEFAAFASALEEADVDVLAVRFRAMMWHLLSLCPNADLRNAGETALARVQHRIRSYPARHLYGLWQVSMLRVAEELRDGQWESARIALERHFEELMHRMRT